MLHSLGKKITRKNALNQNSRKMFYIKHLHSINVNVNNRKKKSYTMKAAEL